MRRATLTKLGLLAFGAVLLSFVVRGFGQLVLGPRTAAVVAGPFVLVAAALVVAVLGLWGLSVVGVLRLEDAEP